MSQHIEWSKAEEQRPAYERITDAYGTESDGPALLLGTNSTLVIEGSKDEILALLDRCREAVEAGAEAVTIQQVRRERLCAALKPCEDRANTTLEDLLLEVEEPDFDVEPWLLLEESNITGEVAASLHATGEQALEYQGDQECAEDWEPMFLINLDTNETRKLRRVYVTEVVS